MNNRQPRNIDGFVLRRRVQEPRTPNKLGTGPLIVPDQFKDKNSGPKIATRRDDVPAIAPVPLSKEAPTGLRRSEIDASLAEIDDTPQQGKEHKRRRIGKKGVKRIFLVILLIGLLIGGYLGVKFFIASGRVFNGNLFDLLGTGKELKKDEFGRTNVLIFGTSEDDPSHEDAAPNLADSIMVLSIDQKTKEAAMFSVPRDLYVKYGQACNSGYQGKINEVYQCNLEGADENTASTAFMDLVGDHFGLDMQYYVHVNYTVLKESVDAVGGITVNIESDDPRGILDRNFDWKCNYTCYYVKWPNGPAQLDGEHALALARARNAAGGYGLSRANFDREQNQQKILIALKDKAVSAGTLANPVAINGLIDSLGNNVRTNFDAGEVKTLMGIATDIKNEQIKRIDLIAEGESVLTTGSVDGAGSIVRPLAGLNDFSKVKSYIRAQISQPADSESAVIEVLNGSDTSGVAAAKAEELAEKGVIVDSTGDAPTDPSYGVLQWFDLTGGAKPKNAAKLAEVLGEPSSGSTLPDGVQSDADFVIIVGNGVN